MKEREEKVGKSGFCLVLFVFFFFFPPPSRLLDVSSSSFQSPGSCLLYTMEKDSIDAAKSGCVEEVRALLRANPDLDVTRKDLNYYCWTALHSASRGGHAEVVKLLLAQAAINVNELTTFGSTPFSFACSHGKVSVVRVLLKDPRVNVTLIEEDECTPLWWAAYHGHFEVVEWLIASGRDLGDLSKEMGQGFLKSTTLEIAEKKKKTEVAWLLERFMANPAKTRRELKVKIGVLDELAAEMFALTLFLCDDLLQPKPPLATPTLSTHDSTATISTTTNAATRFFAIASKLPMELQMVLYHRAVGSLRQHILHKDSEAAFKALALTLQASFSSSPNCLSKAVEETGAERQRQCNIT